MIQSKFAYINNIQLHYLFAGSGPLMLFLHGFPEFSFSWHKQLEYFSKQYFVVAPDLRGYNLSDKPGKIVMQDLVEDMRALIEFLGYEKCILVGHDWGGMIGMMFAVQHPNHIEKLILLNAAHPVLFQSALEKNIEQQNASRYIEILRHKNAEKMIQSNQYHYFWNYLLSEITEKKIFSDEMRKKYEEAWNQKGALTAMLEYYRQWPLSIALERLFSLKISSETLLIWGEKDRCLIKNLAYDLKNIIENLTIEFISSASHWLHHEFPEKINTIINRKLINKN